MGTVQANMSVLFDSAKQKLDQLFLDDPVWVRDLQIDTAGGFFSLEYNQGGGTQFLQISSNGQNERVVILAKLQLPAIAELDVRAERNSEKVMVVSDDTSTRLVTLHTVLVRLAYVIIETLPQTDAYTVECILDCVVKAMRRGV